MLVVVVLVVVVVVVYSATRSKPDYSSIKYKVYKVYEVRPYLYY